MRLDKSLEIFWVERVKVCALDRDFSTADKIREAAVHVDHSLSRACLDNSTDLVNTLFANEVGHRGIIYKKLVRWDKTTRDARDKALRKNTGE